MKKYFLFFLVLVFSFDTADAQDLFAGREYGGSNSGLSQSSESSLLMKKRKKKRRKSSKRKGKGRSSDVTFAVSPALFLGFPTGDFGKAVKSGMGFNLSGEYFVAPQFSVGANFGSYSFKYGDPADTLLKLFVEAGFLTIDDKAKYTVTPFCIKGTYYFTDGPVQPYASLQAGMFVNKSKFTMGEKYIFLNELTQEWDSTFLSTEYLDMTTNFGIVPAFGALFNVSDKVALNANLQYDMVFGADGDYLSDKTQGLSFFGLNLGLVFKF